MADSPPPPAKRPVAVALQYAWDGKSLPQVVAKGQGSVAEQILQIAFANGIRVREDEDLANMLSAVDLDCEIPVEALVAVAEILSYIYRANAQSQAMP